MCKHISKELHCKDFQNVTSCSYLSLLVVEISSFKWVQWIIKEIYMFRCQCEIYWPIISNINPSEHHSEHQLSVNQSCVTAKTIPATFIVQRKSKWFKLSSQLAGWLAGSPSESVTHSLNNVPLTPHPLPIPLYLSRYPPHPHKPFFHSPTTPLSCYTYYIRINWCLFACKIVCQQSLVYKINSPVVLIF